MIPNWLWALGCIIAYLVGGGAAAGWALNRKWSVDSAISTGLFWPVAMPVLLGVWLGTKRLKPKPVEQVCPECKRRSEYR